MASILSLFIHSWIPISIIENYIACPRKIETDSSWASTADKTEYSWIIIESLYDCLPELCFCVAIESYVVEFEHIKYFLEYVKHFSHLCEY